MGLGKGTKNVFWKPEKADAFVIFGQGAIIDAEVWRGSHGRDTLGGLTGGMLQSLRP